MWEKFPSGGPPPPSLDIFTFFYRFFAIFEATELEKTEKNMEWVWVRPLPPLWEFSPHNPVFLLTTSLLRKVHMTLNDFWRGLWLIVCSLDQDHGRRSCHEGSRHYLFKIDISPRKICLKSQFFQINEQMKPKTCFFA